MLLANIIRTLPTEEIARVRKESRLSKRSMKLFDLIVLSSASPPKSAELCKKLKITPENLYRIYSEIVSECLRVLAPKEHLGTLAFFCSKFLYRPFISEYKRLEKNFLMANDKENLELLYEYVFKKSSQFSTHQIDLHLTEEIGRKWLRSQKHPAPDDDFYITLRMIYLHIAIFPARKTMTIADIRSHGQKLLKPVRKRAAKTSNVLARYYYYLAEAEASEDDSEMLGWMRRCLYVVRSHPEKFSSGREEGIELAIAYELGTKWGKAADALQTYRKYYHGQTPDSSAGVFFLLRFIRVAFVAKDFETAWKILKLFMQYHIVQATPHIYRMTVIMQAKLELIEGSLDLAEQTIQTARKLMKEKYHLSDEVRVRGLETTIAFKLGKYEFADRLIQRNIKWLHLRKMNLSYTAWIYYYHMLADLIRYRMTKEPIRRKVLERFRTDFRFDEPEFFLLLEPEILKLQ
jgi:hypothetical protein